MFHLQTPCSDLERSPLFHPNRGGDAGSRLSATCRNVSSRAVGVVLATAPLRARRLPHRACGRPTGSRTPGRVQRWHRNCPASVVDIGPGRCQVMAPDRCTGPPPRRTNRWRRVGLPDGGGSRRIRLMPGTGSRGDGRGDLGGQSAWTLANGLRAPRASSPRQHGGVSRGPWAGVAATAAGRTTMSI